MLYLRRRAMVCVWRWVVRGESDLVRSRVRRSFTVSWKRPMMRAGCVLLVMAWIEISKCWREVLGSVRLIHVWEFSRKFSAGKLVAPSKVSVGDVARQRVVPGFGMSRALALRMLVRWVCLRAAEWSVGVFQ